jgi:hypothetical protein
MYLIGNVYVKNENVYDRPMDGAVCKPIVSLIQE